MLVCVELRAVFTLTELALALRSLTPFRLVIDSELGRTVELAEPAEITLVPGKGLQVRTSGAVQWSLAGVPIRGVVQAVDVLLEPSVETTDRGVALRFRLTLSNLDLKHTPGLVDDTILAQVNAGLEADSNALRFYVGQTLAGAVAIPHVLPKTKLKSRAKAGQIDISGTEVTIKISIGLEVQKHHEQE
jgi:hypothetical protein